MISLNLYPPLSGQNLFYLFFMAKKKMRLPKSIRKHIREEKARIRREVLDLEEQKRLIRELYEKFNIKKIPNPSSSS